MFQEFTHATSGACDLRSSADPGVTLRRGDYHSGITRSGKGSVSTRIPAYFSHSYGREDRDLNDYFWTVFYEEGFSFTVDPKSTFLSTTYLELMMARRLRY